MTGESGSRPNRTLWASELFRPFRERHRLDAGDRLLDRVGDALQLDLVVVDDRVRRARVAVAGLADAPGVEHDHVVDHQVELHVRVADADDVGVDVLEPLAPRSSGP